MAVIAFRRIVQEIEDHYEWNDDQLAEKVFVHRTTISRIRTGGITDPSYTLGAALHRIYDKMRDDRRK